jgi:hypothetical protein
MIIKLYISLPKKYDKQEVIFFRTNAKKKQKSIKINRKIEEATLYENSNRGA